MTINTRIKDTLCELLHINGGWYAYRDNLLPFADALFRCGVARAFHDTSIGYVVDDITITKEDYEQWVKRST